MVAKQNGLVINPGRQHKKHGHSLYMTTSMLYGDCITKCRWPNCRYREVEPHGQEAMFHNMLRQIKEIERRNNELIEHYTERMRELERRH